MAVRNKVHSGGALGDCIGGLHWGTEPEVAIWGALSTRFQKKRDIISLNDIDDYFQQLGKRVSAEAD